MSLTRGPLVPLFSSVHGVVPGTAAMLAHMIRNDPKAKEAAGGIKMSAVGVATPAVLTAELAESCSDYITSVVLMVSHGVLTYHIP